MQIAMQLFIDRKTTSVYGADQKRKRVLVPTLSDAPNCLNNSKLV